MSITGGKSTRSMSTKQNMLINAGASLFYLFCNWITTILVITFSPSYSAAGTLAVAMAVGNIFATIMLFRARILQVTDTSEKTRSGHYVMQRILTFALASIFCAVYSLCTVALNDLLVVFLFLGFKAVESFVDVFHGVDQKNNRFDLIGSSLMVRGLLVVVSFCIGLLVFKSLTWAVFLMLLTTLAFALLFDAAQSGKLDVVKPLYDFSILKRIIILSSAGFFATLFATFIVSFPRQLYALLFGNEALGIYAALASPTVIIQALVSYLYAPLIKPLSDHWESGNFPYMRRIILRVVISVTVIILLLSLFFAFFGDPLFSFVFKKDVGSYLYLMNPLIIATGCAALSSFFSDLLIIAKKFKQVFIVNIAGLLVMFASVYFFLNGLGANGISYTVIVSYAVVILSGAVIYLFAERDKKEKVLL